MRCVTSLAPLPSFNAFRAGTVRAAAGRASKEKRARAHGSVQLERTPALWDTLGFGGRHLSSPRLRSKRVRVFALSFGSSST